MKYLIFLLTICSVVSCSAQGSDSAQDTEFKMYPGGLMYNDTTMQQLGFIVDSLNLKFKRCALNRTYYSKYQAKGHHISLLKGKIREAKKDMENNISFDEFIRKYPRTEIEKDLLIIKYRYTDEEGENIIEFRDVAVSANGENRIFMKNKPGLYEKSLVNKWIFNNWDSDNSIDAFYFTTEFENQAFPLSYARMIQYADCMVDTSVQIFKGEGLFSRFRETKNPKVSAFLNYVNKITDQPVYGDDHQKYATNYKLWESRRFIQLDPLSKQNDFQGLLKTAYAEALKQGSSDEFEQYVAQYISKKAALELKRSRRVMGMCSMDNSPRVHAFNIAVLSAEAVDWETFLRAHLDIMNDRFDRMSDGSYAWQGRQTYIKELEELEINVADLLFGITFRMENGAKNHYYSNISRIGRALSESKDRKVIAEQMITMIRDNSLDDYNRILIYYLFDNYNYHIQDKEVKKENIEKLKIAIGTLPGYLSGKIKVLDK